MIRIMIGDPKPPEEPDEPEVVDEVGNLITEMSNKLTFLGQDQPAP